MKASDFNGCKVYNLSNGKALPSWISYSKRRALAKDEDFNKRLELIQDFEVPTAAQCISMTRDAEHILVAGTYQPIIKCYTTTDMALKFQRGLTCEVVSMESLSEDYGKVVFLQSDRTLSFHAPYGTHYSVRVPKFGRHLQYNWNNCDLYCGGSGNEIFRLNLESGQFKEPFQLKFDGCNRMHINPVHQLLGCAGEGGICEFWDPRSRHRVTSLKVNDPGANSNDITEIKFDTNGLTMLLGTASGFCHLYDMRSKQPLYSKEHQYGLPIVDLTFHSSSADSTRYILSCDKKLVKVWERDGSNQGKVLANIETSAPVNALCVARDRHGADSTSPTGLIMLAGEQSKIMTYFVPQLGPAPRWCSFLEGLTEELEDGQAGEGATEQPGTVYEDYKFITRQELDDIGGAALLGTSTLRPYMHGFFMEMKAYSKLRAVAKPFEYEEYRKLKLKEKLDAKRENRIATVKPVNQLPKINAELAKKLMKKKGDPANGLVDDRFKAVFEQEDFQVDEEADEYRQRHPNTEAGKAAAKRRRADDSDDDNEEDEYDDDSDDEDEGLLQEIDDDREDVSEDDYDPAAGDEENLLLSRRRSSNKKRGFNDNDDEDDMGEIEESTRRMRQREQLVQQHASKKMKMFTLAEGVSAQDLIFTGAKQKQDIRRNMKTLSQMPMNQRMNQQRSSRGGDGSGGRGRGRGGGRGADRDSFRSRDSSQDRSFTKAFIPRQQRDNRASDGFKESGRSGGRGGGGRGRGRGGGGRGGGRSFGGGGRGRGRGRSSSF